MYILKKCFWKRWHYCRVVASIIYAKLARTIIIDIIVNCGTFSELVTTTLCSFQSLELKGTVRGVLHGTKDPEEIMLKT